MEAAIKLVTAVATASFETGALLNTICATAGAVVAALSVSFSVACASLMAAFESLIIVWSALFAASTAASCGLLVAAMAICVLIAIEVNNRA